MNYTLPNKEDLLSAREVLRTQIHQTPILQSSIINEKLGCEVFFKSEHLQKTGSFKVRGAYFSIHTLSDAEKAKGVITHSSGNHGQALAWAGRKQNVEVHVVVPEDAPAVKLEAMRFYGATIHLCAPGQAARETRCNELISEHNFSFIPPYDDYRIITGQSTMMQECIEQLSEMTKAYVPVGGGGLMSGSLLAGKYLRPDLAIVGAEPKNADDARISLDTGIRQDQPNPDTMADGLRTALGERNFDIIQKEVKGITTVSEEEILEAMTWIYKYLKQAVEPSAAVSLAAVMKEKEQLKGQKVLSILCGGNTDLSKLPF